MRINKNRIAYIDDIKGFGILCVVVGHCSSFANSFIFLFHMPLFFFISGFLFKYKEPKEFISNKIKRLLLPYSIYLFIIYTIEMFISRDVSFVKLTNAFVLGGQYLTGMTGVFWFTTCLFFTLVLYNFSQYIRTKILLFLVLLSLVLAYLNQFYFNYFIPWNLNVTLFAIVFFYLGNRFKARIAEIKFNFPVVFSLLLLGSIALIVYNFPSLTLDMKKTNYGVPILSLMLGVICIFSVFMIFKNLHLSFFSYFGKASMIIMYLHQFIHYTLLYFNKNIHQIIIIIAALIIPTFIYYLLKKNKFTSKLFLGE